MNESFKASRLITTLALWAAPFLFGCASIQNSGVQTFSSGISSAKSQTDLAFQAVTDLTSQSIIEYAAAQPKLSDANFLPVLNPASIAIWDSVFAALQKYSQSLVLLTSPTLTKDFEDSAVGLATEVKQAGDDLKSQKVISQPLPSSPSIAAAFTELGDLLLRLKAQHDVKAALLKADPAVRQILNAMADAIGTSSTNQLRGTVRANWEQRKAEQKAAFVEAKPADRTVIATKYATLLNSETTQDLALASLRRSLLALADAHHALANNQSTSVATAVATVEQEIQNTLTLAGRFQAATKNSK
jgi:hypothetical protein